MPLDDTATTNVASTGLYWRTKCDGLTDEDLRRRSMPPSTLSLLGVVRHMAEVERAWFRRVINRDDIRLGWSDEGDFHVAYGASTATQQEAFGAWGGVRTRTLDRRAAESLDVKGHQLKSGEDLSLRLVMLHLIHEYARHGTTGMPTS
jgi:hypothetical protein